MGDDDDDHVVDIDDISYFLSDATIISGKILATVNNSAISFACHRPDDIQHEVSRSLLDLISKLT